MRNLEHFKAFKGISKHFKALSLVRIYEAAR